MTDEARRTEILVDTNALVDLVLGITLAFCGNNALREIKRILQKINDNNASLILTERSIQELKRVLSKRNIRDALRVCRCDPKEIVDTVVNAPGIDVVSIDEDKEKTVIRNYSRYVRTYGVSFPREDAHVLAALVKRNPDFFVSRDEKVYQVANIISNKEGLGISIKGLKGLVYALVTLDAIDKHTRYIIGYEAYKAQIIPFTHEKAFECGFSNNIQGLESWVKYSQRKLQEYIPHELQGCYGAGLE